MELPWTAQRLITDVDAVIGRADTQFDLQIQSDLAKYLVVRVGGLVEQVISEVVLAHVRTRSAPTVSEHVEWRMKAFQNPSVERVLQLVGSFGKVWRAELEALVTQSEREALASVMLQRNKVAHGEDSTVSLAQVKQYYSEIRSLLDKVATKF